MHPVPAFVRSNKTSKRLITLMLSGMLFTACNSQKSKLPLNSGAEVLLFNGTGASANDVKAFETLLNDNQLTYSTITSSQLNAITEQQLLKYKLLVVAGGNFIDMGKSLTDSTAIHINKAVQKGLNYHGICAGGFLAGGSKYYRCFNLTSGITFGFYSISAKGIRKAAVSINYPDGTRQQHYWEDGPEFSGWGTVAAKYADNAPAVVQGQYGKGLIILTCPEIGLHNTSVNDEQNNRDKDH